MSLSPHQAQGRPSGTRTCSPGRGPLLRSLILLKPRPAPSACPQTPRPHPLPQHHVRPRRPQPCSAGLPTTGPGLNAFCGLSQSKLVQTLWPQGLPSQNPSLLTHPHAIPGETHRRHQGLDRKGSIRLCPTAEQGGHLSGPGTWRVTERKEESKSCRCARKAQLMEKKWAAQKEQQWNNA